MTKGKERVLEILRSRARELEDGLKTNSKYIEKYKKEMALYQEKVENRLIRRQALEIQIRTLTKEIEEMEKQWEI